jgi:hypothetical protein
MFILSGFILDFSMLFAMNGSNNNNLLATKSTLTFLNNYPQETLSLMPIIILIIIFLVYVVFPPHD